MSRLFCIAKRIGADSITWRVGIVDPSPTGVARKIASRAVDGEKDEPLLRVIDRTVTLHRLMMIASGETMTDIVVAEYRDPNNRRIVSPRLEELLARLA